MMRRHSLAIGSCVLAFLAACGGSNSDGSASPPGDDASTSDAPGPIDDAHLGDAGGDSPAGRDGATSDGGTTTPAPFGSACKVTPSTVTTPLAAGAAVSVTIDVATVTCGTSSDFVGTNFEAFPGWGADVSLSDFQKTAFRAAGTQLFRYPGGEPGEWVDLLMTTKCKDGSNANWNAPAYTALWDFAKTANLDSLMLQTNPTNQYCGTGDQDGSGAHAAALAKDAATHGVKAVFEVGNEPDISSYFKANGGQDGYITKFIDHASAIHAANPDAKVYGPAVCGLGGNCSFPTTWDSGWIGAFLAKTGDKATGAGKATADGVSFHVYWHPEWGYSDLAQAKIDKYGFAEYWATTMMPYLYSLIAKYDSRNLPIAISEISIGNGIASDGGQTQNMFTVLETLDTVASFAASGLRSFQWFDANASGPSDFWMITPKAARPIFYAFAAWSRMGRDVLATTSDARPHDFAVYATKRDDGSVQVLLINKTNGPHDVTLSFEGGSPAGKSMTTTTVEPATAASDASKSIVFDGATDPLPSALPAPKTATADASPKVTVPAYSASVITFGP